LREAVDDFIDMDDNPHKYLIGYRMNRLRRGNDRGPKNQIQKVVGTDTDSI
jgi:hypothetical protein